MIGALPRANRYNRAMGERGGRRDTTSSRCAARLRWLAAVLATGLIGTAHAQSNPGGMAPAVAPRVPMVPTASSDKPRMRITVLAHSSLGKVFCAVWRGPNGYPTKRKLAAYEGVDRRLRANRGVIEIDKVEPGEYAIACFHDENANNDLDTNFLGIPIEGTGASNDAHGFMGPPSYKDARFTVGPSGTRRVSVPMRYLF